MIAGATPIRASVSAKVLRGPATAMSQRADQSHAAGPDVAVDRRRSPAAATRGSRAATPPFRGPAAAAVSAGIRRRRASLRSAPAQKVPPVWPSTTARTAGSSAASRRPWCSWLTNVGGQRVAVVRRVQRQPRDAARRRRYSTRVVHQYDRGRPSDVCATKLSTISRLTGAMRPSRDDGQHRGDAVLLGQPVAAQRLHGLVDRARSRLARSVLGHVRGLGGAAVVAAVVERGGLLHHQLGQLDLDVVLRQRM